MKYLVSLFLGLVLGAVLFAAGLIYNPFISAPTLSPITVSDARKVVLGFSALPSDSIVHTNDGESRIEPYPEKVQEFWEEAIRQTTAMATVLRDSRGQVAGLGIKMISASEETRLLSGEVLFDSVWYVYLPERGAFFVAQNENHWDFARDVVLPAYRSSANTWKGSWLGNITSGPEALSTAHVSGSSGEFTDMEMLAVESLSMRVWRVDQGPVAADGQLTVELPNDNIVLDETFVNE